MVQIINSPRSLKNQSLSILMKSLSEGLGNFTGDYFANKSLEKVLNDPKLKNAPVSERLNSLQRALSPYGQRGENLLQSHLQIEQQRQQEQQRDQLAEALGDKSLTGLPLEQQTKIAEIKRKKNLGKTIFDSLKKAGYPDETSTLWQQQFQATDSLQGQSDVIKNVNDLIRRSKTGKGIQEQEEKVIIKPKIEIPGIKSESFNLDFPEIPEPIGRTSADIVKQESDREKVNVPLYSETIDKLNALDEDFREISQLQEYNETPGALPQGLQKWNVDWDTGDLRIKALATPETQAYVKIISRMLNKAKDFYPGRVTNFDLNQFKQQFPTLANSKEGRELIANQLALANRIAYLKDETLKASIDHYGAGADPISIRKYATENYRKLKGELENQLKDINSKADTLIKNQPSIIKMIAPNGRPMNVPIDDIERLESLGAKRA